MATLSGKTTSGELAFDKYVTKNPRFNEIEYEIEAKMTASFLQKKGAQYVEVSELKAGTTFKIVKKDVVKIGKMDHAEVKYKSKIGYIAIGKIRKPTKGNGTAYEDEVVDELNRIFLEIGRPIDIKVGNKYFKNLCYAIKVDSNIKRAGGVSSDPKADIIICEDIKNPFKGTPIYISHKKEGGPEAFQQYGGLTEAAGVDIYNHKEVQSFLRKTVNYVEDGKLTSPLMMSIKDIKLKNMSIYGPEYGGPFSLQHTQLIGQGKPILKKKSEKQYELDFSSHMSVSGDLSHFSGGYNPVFGATFRAGRGYTIDNQRVDGVRVGIYPEKLIAGRGGLIKLG
jgi:hypothetical protein